MTRCAIECVFRIFACVPRRLCIRAGKTLGWMLEHLVRFRREEIDRNLSQAFPALNPREHQALRHRVYRHFGLLFTEFLQLPSLASETLTDESFCTVHGEERLQAALAHGNGIMILTAHVGSWETALAAMSARQYDIRAVVKEQKGELGQYVASRMRESHGVRTIPRRNAMRKIRYALKENAAVSFVLDQNMTSDEGVFVTFFGRPACTMSSLAALSSRYACPVVPLYCYRDADLRRHHVVVGEPLEWESTGQGRKADLTHNTQRYTDVLEDIIRRHPDQWIWMHRRWRTKPR